MVLYWLKVVVVLVMMLLSVVSIEVLSVWVICVFVGIGNDSMNFVVLSILMVRC